MRGCTVYLSVFAYDKCLVSSLLLSPIHSISLTTFITRTTQAHPPGIMFPCLTGAGETLDVEVGLLYSYHLSFAYFPTPLAPDWSSTSFTTRCALVISWWRQKYTHLIFFYDLPRHIQDVKHYFRSQINCSHYYCCYPRLSILTQ